jgi:hypothetical protein
MSSGRFGVGRVWLLFTILSVLWTLPLSLHLTTHLPYGSTDLWQNLWNFWWWGKAVGAGANPFETDALFHPFGTSLALHTHSPLNMLVALPVTWTLGPVAAYNVVQLAGLVLSGVGAWLLARDLCGNERAALVAGLIFAFFPHRLEQMTEHLNLASVQFFPFLLWAHHRLLEGRGRRYVVLTGLFFAANALVSWHYGLFGALALGLTTVLHVVSTRSRAGVAGTVWSVALGALLVTPFVLPVLEAIGSGREYVKYVHDRGSDLLFLLLPSDHHPVLGPLVEPLYRAYRSYPGAGFLCYVGLVPLVLAGHALRRGWREALPWAVFGGVFLLLSLGSQPLFAGDPVPGVRGPHLLLAWLPILSALRVANRFHVLFMLALAVLAAIGLSKTKRPWAVWAACALVPFEYLWLPFPVRDVREYPLHPYLASLQADPAAGAVLDIPFDTGANTAENMAAQTVHERPLADGYVSVTDPATLVEVSQDPDLAALRGMRPRFGKQIDWARLAELGFGTVVLHRERGEAWQDARLAACGAAGHYCRKGWSRARIPDLVLDRLSEDLGRRVGPPIFADERIEVFRLRR